MHIATSDHRERLLQIISDHHDQLAAFARDGYALDGRGVLQVEFPDVPPGMTATDVTTTTYVALAEMRRLFPAPDEDASVLLRMIDTYDPERQAVVMASLAGGNPISIKMKLERPIVTGESGVAASSEDENAIFETHQQFLDAHKTCPAGPEQFKYFIWLPRGRPEYASVTVTCACGTRKVMPTSRKVGQALLASFRMNGMFVAESDGPDTVQ